MKNPVLAIRYLYLFQVAHDVSPPSFFSILQVSWLLQSEQSETSRNPGPPPLPTCDDTLPIRSDPYLSFVSFDTLLAESAPTLRKHRDETRQGASTVEERNDRAGEPPVITRETGPATRATGPKRPFFVILSKSEGKETLSGFPASPGPLLARQASKIG
ncbi:MAG: hypothetical protein R6V85_09870 [Polyangia bacterium]